MNNLSLGELNSYNQGAIWDNVFSFLSKKENMKNARVCHLWNERISNNIKKEQIKYFEEKTIEKLATSVTLPLSFSLETLSPEFKNIRENQRTLSLKYVKEALNKLEKTINFYEEMLDPSIKFRTSDDDSTPEQISEIIPSSDSD